MQNNTEDRRRRRGWLWFGAGLVIMLLLAGGLKLTGDSKPSSGATPSPTSPAGTAPAQGPTEVLGATEQKADQGRAAAPQGRDFGISGQLNAALAPGVTRSLNLSLTNPYDTAITVTGVTVTVADETAIGDRRNPACVGPQNLHVTRQLTTTVNLDAKATRSLSDLGVAPADWPQLLMPNLPTNQDACKGATFNLSYTGTAQTS